MFLQSTHFPGEAQAIGTVKYLSIKVTLLTYGSRGDVQPFLALALDLQKAGHQVKLTAPHRFDRFVYQYNVPSVPRQGILKSTASVSITQSGN